MSSTQLHIPVLRDQLLPYLRETDTVFVDGTLGHGGHMIATAHHLSDEHRARSTFVGVDKDASMLARATARIDEQQFGGRWIHAHTPYDQLGDVLRQHEITADRLLLDIGVNREHFADPARGFSCKHDGPLDMRFDTAQPYTARDRLMRTNTHEISLAMQTYGDLSKRFSDHMGRTIVDLRKKHNRHTTREFTDFLHSELEVGRRVIAIIFQVIRICTNDELAHLDRFLDQCLSLLSPGGRCAIISYHSGEDKRVKHAFKQFALANDAIIHTKKPMVPTRDEINANNAASSAKCRIIEKHP